MFLPAVSLLFLFAAGPPDSSSLLRSGLQALQQGRLPEARADLDQAAKLTPDNALVWVSLAEVDLRLNDMEAAEAAAAHAEQNGTGNSVVVHALALYYSEAGQFFLASGDEGRALASAEKAAANSPEIAFNWAQLLLGRQEFGPAAGLLEQSLKRYPNNAQLELALGVARYGQRRFEDAISGFLNVIRIDPSIPQPYEFLGRMLDQAGPRLPEITALYEKRSAQAPGDAEAQLQLAKALLMADSRNPRAESLLRRSIELGPNAWESHYELGVLLANTHRYPDAAAELSRAIGLDPKQAMPHYHLARVYDRLGQPEKAAAERAVHAGLTASDKPQ